MATIKSFTSLEQSRKLAEILPIESADMCYVKDDELQGYYMETVYTATLHTPYHDKKCIPCWSLAALLGVLPVTATLLKDGNISNIGDVKYNCECSMVSIHKWFDNPVDACYEMILKLKEKELI